MAPMSAFIGMGRREGEGGTFRVCPTTRVPGNRRAVRGGVGRKGGREEGEEGYCVEETLQEKMKKRRREHREGEE